MSIFSEETITSIEERLNYQFKNKQLLMSAFIHPSYFNENKDPTLEHNERLEFLGDSALGLVVTEYLFQEFPQEEEGMLSLFRSKIVDATSCASYAKQLGFSDFVLLGRGEKRSIGRGKETIFADLFEAIMGALFADGGFEAVRHFFLHSCLELAKQKIEQAPNNYKALLQETLQKKYRTSPIYKVFKEEGPEHAKNFHVVVYLGDNRLGEGEGPSKKQAEQMAAREAWLKLGEENGQS